MYTANDEKNYLAKYIKEFKTKTKPPYNSFKKVKEEVINSAMVLLKGREMVFKTFESRIFSKLKESGRSNQSNGDVKYSSFGHDKHKFSKKFKDISWENILSYLNDTDITDNKDNKLFTPVMEGTGLKISTPKQMLQRLPIAPAQIKAGNNSKTLLNEVRQIVYSLHQSKKLLKKYITL